MRDTHNGYRYYALDLFEREVHSESVERTCFIVGRAPSCHARHRAVKTGLRDVNRAMAEWLSGAPGVCTPETGARYRNDRLTLKRPVIARKEKTMPVSNQETHETRPQKRMTATEIQKTLQTMADGFRVWPRAPILHRPEDEGMEYEDVTFPSKDGVPLEGVHPGSRLQQNHHCEPPALVQPCGPSITS